MLCQLSYASGKSVAEGLLERATDRRSIFIPRSRSEGEGDAAGDGPICLREKQCAAIRCDERAISLRKKVPHVDHSLRAAGKHAPHANRLAKQNAQIGVAGGEAYGFTAVTVSARCQR